MAGNYTCAYCGSVQTWSGTGLRICRNCGATQPEKPGSASPSTTTTETGATPRRRNVRLVTALLLVLLGLIGVLLLILRRSGHTPAASDVPSVALRSRILAVNNPLVRTLPPHSDMSAPDILRSAPANASRLFDTSLLTITKPRPVNDIDGKLWFVGEVTNHSPDRIALAPTVQVRLQNGGHTMDSRDLSFSDLPPGGHVPLGFVWDGDPKDVQDIVCRWKPVLGRAKNGANPTQLVITVDSHKVVPGTVNVNFSYTYHYVTEKMQGTVTNRGDTTARDVQVYLTLYDAKNHVTGFKAQSLQPIAPGEQVRYNIEADQWGDPEKTIDIEVLPATQANL